jgi:hypothetical protein
MRFEKFYSLITPSQATSKHHIQTAIKIRKLQKIHIFPITKFALAQTKLGKFYPNI